jgi:hypothetical protein
LRDASSEPMKTWIVQRMIARRPAPRCIDERVHARGVEVLAMCDGVRNDRQCFDFFNLSNDA